MTRAEILNCLTDRPCDVCRFHESGRCERWDCVFEEKTDDAEDCADKRMTREEAIAKLKNFADHCYPNEEFLMAIKALSAEPCEDAISRQTVMDFIRGLTRWCVRSEDGKFNNVGLLYDDVMFGLDRLPSVTPKQRWIPVHERLPEEYCLFCDIDGDVFYGHIYDGRWWAEGQDDRIKNVIAWMPLPEPYKEENEVTQDADNN